MRDLVASCPNTVPVGIGHTTSGVDFGVLGTKNNGTAPTGALEGMQRNAHVATDFSLQCF